MDKNVARDRDFYRELEGHGMESKVHSCMGHNPYAVFIN